MWLLWAFSSQKVWAPVLVKFNVIELLWTNMTAAEMLIPRLQTVTKALVSNLYTQSVVLTQLTWFFSDRTSFVLLINCFPVGLILLQTKHETQVSWKLKQKTHSCKISNSAHCPVCQCVFSVWMRLRWREGGGGRGAFGSRCVTLLPSVCADGAVSSVTAGSQKSRENNNLKKKKTNPKNNKIEPQQEAAAATFHFLRRIKAEAGAEQETKKREASRDWHGPCSTWQASSWRLFSKIKHSGLFSPAQAGSRAYGPQVKNKDNAHTLAYIMQRDPHLICKFPEILLNTFCSERIHLNLQLELSCIINEKRQFLAAA